MRPYWDHVRAAAAWTSPGFDTSQGTPSTRSASPSSAIVRFSVVTSLSQSATRYSCARNHRAIASPMPPRAARHHCHFESRRHRSATIVAIALRTHSPAGARRRERCPGPSERPIVYSCIASPACLRRDLAQSRVVKTIAQISETATHARGTVLRLTLALSIITYFDRVAYFVCESGHSRGAAPHAHPNRLGVLGVHVCLRRFRNPERLARRRDRPAESPRLASCCGGRRSRR